MAIEKNIPQDICKFESKLIGPLTTRNVMFGVPGVILGLGTYFLLGNISFVTLSQDIKIIIAIFLAMPFFLCGWVKIYGIKFEKFASMVFVSMIWAPKHRLYKTKNTFEFLTESDVPTNKKAEEKKQKIQKAYVSKNPNLKPFT